MPDCGVRGPRFESYRGQLFIKTATAIYSLGHGLYTLLQCLGWLSLPPSVGRYNEYQLSGWVIIKWRWWMWTVAAISFWRTRSESVGLVWDLAATSALSLHSSNEPGELSQWLCHDDSTINIISVIIIIIDQMPCNCVCIDFKILKVKYNTFVLFVGNVSIWQRLRCCHHGVAVTRVTQFIWWMQTWLESSQASWIELWICCNYNCH